MQPAVSGADRGSAPLAGVRVLSLGGKWAGRVASMLLADQGAEVVEINNPAAPRSLAHALLSRGKCEVELNLSGREGQRRAQELAAGADIIVENLGIGRSARFGLDYGHLQSERRELVYVSIPGFATGSPHERIPAWEGTVAASVGVYTDIRARGPILGGAPTFTALPMASAYGGVHASIAASAAFLNRLQTGRGAYIEVPLADALLSAMSLLIMRIEDQPQYFDLPPMDKAMTEVAMPILRDLSKFLTAEHRKQIANYLAKFSQPLFAHHLCGDGRFLFINAIGHVHQPRACVETLGILDTLIAEGMVVANPYQVDRAENNISDAGGLNQHWRQRLRSLLAERFLAKPAAEWERVLQEAAVPASVVRTAHEWLNWGPAEEGGNVTTLSDPNLGTTRQSGRFISIEGARVASPALRPREQWSGAWRTSRAELKQTQGERKRFLEGLRVLDLSNVIAGPVAARILSELGADVTRVDPQFPQAGPRMTMWFGVDVNQGKRSIILDLKASQSREVLARLVRQSDVVIHNSLDRSLASTGIAEDDLRAIKPDIIVCQVSAWGGSNGGPLKDYPAYDPVLQAATGIMTRYGSETAPVMHGLASCVDYITGFSAALGTIHALIARTLGRGGAAVRTSLAMGAQLVQFPFMVEGETGGESGSPAGQDAVGYGAHYRLYEARDGWALLCCRERDTSRVAGALASADSSAESISSAVSRLEIEEISRRLAGIESASAVPVMRLDELRKQISIAEEAEPHARAWERGLLMVDASHPSGHRISLPFPSWYRSGQHLLTRLSPAPKPGAHTVEVLEELKFNASEIAALLGENVAAKGWTVLRDYFPSP